MVDVFVHRTGLDTAAVEESRDLVQMHSGCDLLQQATNGQNHVILHDVRVWGAQSPSRCRYGETARRSSFVYKGESCS